MQSRNVRSKARARDNGKFLALEENRRLSENVYYFTIDDDIVYPADYTNSMIARLQRLRESLRGRRPRRTAQGSSCGVLF